VERPTRRRLLKQIIRTLTTRKLETATLAIVAAGTAVGLGTRARDAHEPVSAPTISYITQVAKLTPAVVATPVEAPVATSAMDLPQIDNPQVDSWIKRFTGDQRSSFATYLKRMSKYDDMLSEKLEQRDMPRGLIFLAMIESGFNPTAKSPVGARGLWQFMSATARQYGLKVRGRVDERVNPARATDAALRYLSDLHKEFGSWYLAAAAYNTGQGRVARIMKQVTGKTKGTDADFYRIAPRLPKETRAYVPKLVAAARIGADPAKYGFGT
jgi:membrane-bound lytic murein transglycosylase D